MRNLPLREFPRLPLSSRISKDSRYLSSPNAVILFSYLSGNRVPIKLTGPTPSCVSPLIVSLSSTVCPFLNRLLRTSKILLPLLLLALRSRWWRQFKESPI